VTMALRTAACLTLLVAEVGAQQCGGRQQAFCDGSCVWTSSGCQSATSNSQCSGRQQQFCSGDCQWSGSYCHQVCYHNNVAYSGDMQGHPITNEVSRDNCKARCSRTSGCHYFTYYTNSRNCHLQDAGASRQSQVGAVSGPAYCNNNRPTPTPAPTPRPSTGGVESMPASVGAATAFGRVTSGNSFQNLVQQLQPGEVAAKFESLLPGWQLVAVAAVASLMIAAAFLRNPARPTRSEEEHTQALTAAETE